MKLVIQGDRIAGTATDEHQATGLEQAVVFAPDDFDLSRIGDYRFDGETVRLPVVTMAERRAQALAVAMEYGNAITARETSQWAGVEPLSWTQQRDEALVVKAGGTLSAFAVLPGLAEDKGVTLAAYADDVLANAARYQTLLRAAVSLRRMATEALLDEALDTPEKLGAAVAELKVHTDELAARLLAGAA